MKPIAGITHVLVSTPKKEQSDKTGLVAVVDLCFGPGDTDSFRLLWMKNQEGQPAFYPPKVEITVGDKTHSFPVFRGGLFEHLAQRAHKAIDAVRTKTGFKFGHSYRVSDNGDVEPVKTAKAA